MCVVLKARTTAMLIYKIQRDMASVLDSTTANKAVTLSDDTAVCGFQNVRPAAEFERCCIKLLKLPRVLDLNFILTSPLPCSPKHVFVCLFFLYPFFFSKRQVNHNCLVNFTDFTR